MMRTPLATLLAASVATAATLPFAAFSATRTWTGGGDGLTWGDGGNWGGSAPAAGDILVFDSGLSGTELVASNDLGTAESPFTAKKVVCTGRGRVSLVGNAISITGDSNETFTNDCPVSCALDISLGSAWTYRWRCVGTLTQTGRIFGADTTRININAVADNCVFSGDIYTPKAELRVNTKDAAENRDVYFDGKLTVKALNDPDGRGTAYIGTVHYRHADNDVKEKVGLPRINISVEAENALGTNVVIAQGWRGNDQSKVVLYADQSIDRFGAPYSVAQADNQHLVVGGAPSRLTMRATGHCVTDSHFNGPLTLVWDPQGDYNFTAVTNHSHFSSAGAVGGIVVKRGTFSVVGTTTTMSGLGFVSVSDDARFAVDVTSALSLSNVNSVVLGERARFEYGSGVRSPHMEKFPAFRLASDAKVVMPSGVSVTGSVFRAGAYLAANTLYTGSDNPEPGDAVPVDWISGAGTFKTIEGNYYYTYWAGGNGNWTETSKWSGGIPKPGNCVRLYDCGGMTLSLSGTVADFGMIQGRNYVDGTTEMLVTTEVNKSNSLTIEGDMRLTVGNGGVLNHGSANVNIRSGAEMRISGGEANFSNYAHTFTVGYQWGARKISRLLVESGSLAVSGASGGSFKVDDYGLVEMTGGTFALSGIPMTVKNATSAIALSGNAKMNLNALTMNSGSTLSLKVGAAAAPRLDVSGTMTVASDSSILVDATEWAAGGGRFGRKKLVSWGAISGTPNVTVVPAEAAQYVVVESDGIKFGPGGSVVIVF